MKKYFTKADIINQEALERDIIETSKRLIDGKINSHRKSDEETIEDTELGLVLEYYLMQHDPKYKKATELNSKDYYHDLVNTESGEIYECKVTRSGLGWNCAYVKRCVESIIKSDWNKSKWMHVADYDRTCGIYTYKGVKQIRFKI